MQLAKAIIFVDAGEALERSPGEGEETLRGGLDVETLQSGQSKEGSVRDLLEVAVDDVELLQPHEASEAARLQLADGHSVGADDGEGDCVVCRDHAEVRPLRVAVDGGQVAGQLQGGVRAISEWFGETVGRDWRRGGHGGCEGERQLADQADQQEQDPRHGEADGAHCN